MHALSDADAPQPQSTEAVLTSPLCVPAETPRPGLPCRWVDSSVRPAGRTAGTNAHVFLYASVPVDLYQWSVHIYQIHACSATEITWNFRCRPYHMSKTCALDMSRCGDTLSVPTWVAELAPPPGSEEARTDLVSRCWAGLVSGFGAAFLSWSRGELSRRCIHWLSDGWKYR